jgi:hypothetical protein
MAGAALCAPAGWCLPTGQTQLFEPTAKQMQAIQKTLGGTSKQRKTVTRPRPLLPAEFEGWSRGGVSVLHPDAKNAAAFKEFGFERGEQASYTRGGDKVAVRVWAFPNATDAYGAFTLLRTAKMKPVRIGPGFFWGIVGKPGAKHAKPLKAPPVALTLLNGAEAGGHLLFWKGGRLVDAQFAGSAVDGRAVLTSFANKMPEIVGGRGAAPALAAQLPLSGLNPESVRYALGPAAYRQEGGVLPPEVLNFEMDAEVVTAQYGKGTLTVISYPTPEIAQAREAAIASVLKSDLVPGAKDALRVKRSGPLVALTSGAFTAAGADALLKQVKFRATITMEQVKPQESEVSKTARLLVGIATLTVILGSASILLGFFLGGGRALYRVMRGKPASTLADEEFISLELNMPMGTGGEPAQDKTAG